MEYVNYNQVKIHENGVEILKPSFSQCRIKSAAASSTRGQIDGFSKKSANRLRRLLLDVDFSESWAMCLTLPGEVQPDEDYNELWHGFVVAYRAAFYNALIWRVELQVRKVPHWHLIFCGEYLDALRLKHFWMKYIERRFPVSRGFYLHSVKIQSVRRSSSALMYLTAHLSKHKSSQLGWKGRQWAVVNRSALRLRSSGSTLSFSDEEWRCVVRQFRRLSERLKIDGIYSGAYTHFRFSRSVFRRLPVDYKKDFKVVKSSCGSLLRRCIFGRDEDRFMRIAVYFSRRGGVPCVDRGQSDAISTPAAL